MSPVDLASPLTGSKFTLGSYDKFEPGFRDEKRPKTSCVAKFEKQSKHGETQSYNFRTYYSFGNSYSCITFVKWDAYMMWKIQQAKQDNVEFIRRIHPAFIPVTGLKCFFMEKFSSPLTKISATEPARPLIWTHRNSFKGFRGKAGSGKPGLVWRGPFFPWFVFATSQLSESLRLGPKHLSNFLAAHRLLYLILRGISSLKTARDFLRYEGENCLSVIVLLQCLFVTEDEE